MSKHFPSSFRVGDEMTFPLPDVNSAGDVGDVNRLSWGLTYLSDPLSVVERLYLASVLRAYEALLTAPLDTVRQVRRAYKALPKSEAARIQ